MMHTTHMTHSTEIILTTAMNNNNIDINLSFSSHPREPFHS